jgi:hypothetical protein
VDGCHSDHITTLNEKNPDCGPALKGYFFLPNYKLNNHYYTFRLFIYKYGNGTIHKYIDLFFNEKNINLVTFSNGIYNFINNSQDVNEVLNVENVANSQQGLILSLEK